MFNVVWQNFQSSNLQAMLETIPADTMEVESALSGQANSAPASEARPLQSPHVQQVSSEDMQALQAMGWSLPKSCRPQQIPEVSQATAGLPSPATVPGQSLAAPNAVQAQAELTAPALPPQAAMPATMPQDGAEIAAQVKPATEQTAQMTAQSALAAPATSAMHEAAKTTVEVQAALPLPATVPQDGAKIAAQAHAGLAHAVPLPATRPQAGAEIAAQAHVAAQPEVTTPATLAHAFAPLPATVPQAGAMIAAQAKPAAVPHVQQTAPTVPLHQGGVHGLTAPATLPQQSVHGAAQTAPATMAPVGAAALPQPAKVPAPSAVPLQQVKVEQCTPTAQQAKEEYSRRAAANLIKRLKENPSRMEGMPSLRSMVMDDSKKSDLISILVEQQGNLQQVATYLQVQEENGRVQIARKRAIRKTKKQMLDLYGEEASKVMKHKEESGMIEKDENHPDGFVYLIAEKEDDVEDFNRTGSMEAFMCNHDLSHVFFFKGKGKKTTL